MLARKILIYFLKTNTMLEYRKYFLSFLLSLVFLTLLSGQAIAFGGNGNSNKVTKKVKIPPLSCIENGDVKLAKHWNWHYPKATPKIRNGNKELRCADGKAGWLYTRSDIDGKYFVANDKWVKSTPVMSDICSATQEFCTPSLKYIKAIKVESSDHKVDLQIPAGTYSREDLLELASAENSELRDAFESIDWMRAGKLASMDSLPQGRFFYSHTEIIGFNDSNSQLTIAHNMNYRNGVSDQVMVATWDIKTKQLQQIIALTVDAQLTAVSANQQWLAIVHDFDELQLYNIHTNKFSSLNIEQEEGYNNHIESVSFSNDGYYLSVSFNHFWVNADKSHDIDRGVVYNKIYQTETGKQVASYSQYYPQANESASLTFSPDNSKFLLSWNCFDCGENKEAKSINEVGDTTTWSTQQLFSFDDEYDSPVFSADSRYLAEWDKAYDIQQSKDIDGYKSCGKSVGGLGDPIINSSLNLHYGPFESDDTFQFNIIRDGQCAKIGSAKRHIGGQYSNFILSQDNKLFALIRQNKAEDYVLEIKAIQLPSDEKIASTVKKIQEDKRENKLYDKAQKAFDAGFPEEALAMMNEVIETKKANPSIIAVNYIKDWATELPLKEVGKSLLRQYEIFVSLPLNKAADGFWGDDEIKVDNGYVIKGVHPESNAEVAGLQKGDIVIKLNGDTFKNEAEYNKHLKNYFPSDNVKLTVLRHNKEKIIQLTLDRKYNQSTNAVWAADVLTSYGKVAAAAGHPELAMVAAEMLRKLLHQHRSSTNKVILGNWATMLEFLSISGRGNINDAYKHAVKKGGFVKTTIENDNIFFLFQLDNQWDRIFLAPLFQDRKKFAYLLGIDESDLPKSPTHIFKPQAYPDLDGNIIAVGGESLVSEPVPKTTTKPVIKKEVEFELLDE